MSSDVQSGDGATATQLLSGIIGDAQDLMKQQLALFRSEVKEDLRKTKNAAILLGGGAAILMLAAIVLCFMFVELLHHLLPDLPHWGCFGIVGGALALIGGGLLAVAISRLNSFNPLPDQTAQSLKENVRWITNPK